MEQTTRPTQKKMTDHELLYMNTTVLAYMGDAVYETYIRSYVIGSGQVHANKLHLSAVRFVKAEAQAFALKSMLDELPEHELGLVKRARNKKISTKAKNADAITYKWATAFEALVGYLHLSGQNGRLVELLEKTIQMIEGKP